MSFLSYLQQQGSSQSTAKSHQGQLKLFENWCDFHHVDPIYATRSELLVYLQSLKEKSLNQRSIANYLNSLRHYYNWQISKGIRLDNPTQNMLIKGVHQRKLYPILSRVELNKLYEEYAIELNDEDLPPVIQRDKLIIGLMIWQGLDTTALQSLTIDDVQLRKGTITVPGSRQSNPRTLKLEAVQVLDFMTYQQISRAALLAPLNKQTDQLLVSTGKGNKIANVLHRVLTVLRGQHAKLVSSRQIRTSVITHWLKQYNLREVQYMAGHRYVSSTEAYQINNLDELQEDVNQYYPL